jgi:Na+-transporting NADH:ubiquinone oxidoreductase subunit C
MAGTLVVATSLCIVCALVVSSAAVGLRTRQEANQQLKLQRNVLVAAGLWEDGLDSAGIDAKFEAIQPVIVNLPRRDGAEPGTPSTDVSLETFDPRKAASDPKWTISIPADLDLAGIRKRTTVAIAYVIRGTDGNIDQLVLPVHGKGLWSTLYGFLAIDRDGRTVRGITFYKHGETPGLGGEVDNPAWKAQWSRKIAVEESGSPIIDVVKGTVRPDSPEAQHQIDGLSGATITSTGVEKLVNYWLGSDGFGPFLDRLRNNTLDLAGSPPAAPG